MLAACSVGKWSKGNMNSNKDESSNNKNETDKGGGLNSQGGPTTGNLSGIYVTRYVHN